MDSTTFSNINWLHVLVAAIGYFALGAIWYSVLFGKKWVAYQNINMDDPDAKKRNGGYYDRIFYINVDCDNWISYYRRKRLELNHFSSGVNWGLLTGLCFSATAISISYLYVKKPTGLHVDNGLYHIIGQIIAAVYFVAGTNYSTLVIFTTLVGRCK